MPLQCLADLRWHLLSVRVIAFGLCVLAILGGPTTACAAGPLDGAVIVVDPGHGGQRYSKSYTGGTRGTISRLTESELNLRVAFELEKLLRENGATVYMTRAADHRMSVEGGPRSDELRARVDFFEHYNPHFFLSVHHNAGSPGSGHTTLYKKDAPEGSLYQSLAKILNDSLEGAVPGPKNKLIDRTGNSPYYILGHTEIPGSITESGFMTSKAFDELSNKPEFPKQEAEAICKGAIKYWTERKAELIALRDRLQKARDAKPPDPRTYKAIDLNPEYQANMRQLLNKMEPGGMFDPAKIGTYVEGAKNLIKMSDPQAVFDVKGEYDGKQIKLTGRVSDRRYHDNLINMLIAMRLFNISNGIAIPAEAE
jgi:N-acetylmuramoyl-L-alanine amidase